MSAYKSQFSAANTASARPPMAPSSFNGASAAAIRTVGCADVQDRQIYPPALPSNLQRDADQDVVFNSIGFYSDLLNRLDSQIQSTEDVFVQCQVRVSQQQQAQAPTAHHM